MRFFAVYGASGCGRGVMPLLRAQLGPQLGSVADLVFVDDGLAGREVNGCRVLGYEEWLSTDASERWVSIAIADSAIRERIARRCTADGVHFIGVRAANVVTMDDVSVGEGSILCPFVTLTSNVRIGRHFHANLYSYVEHDCVVGDFVTFAPGVHCNGNVTIGDHVYVGAGAILRQGRPDRPLVVGRGAVIGMGAVVTSDVDAGATVVGNPARALQRSRS